MYRWAWPGILKQSSVFTHFTHNKDVCEEKKEEDVCVCGGGAANAQQRTKMEEHGGVWSQRWSDFSDVNAE